MPKDKVIAYFSKYRIGQSAGLNQDTGIPLVPKSGDDRKVLVDAGNRCVVPVKSRPKKRKTVKPLQLAANKGGNGSPIRATEAGTQDVAESVLWSDQVYTVRHLVKQFEGQFPVIVRVDEGHYREGVVDLARGLVLLVSDHGKQQRVLARNNSTETLLSLPVDYRMDILLSSSAEVVGLQTALKEMELPFTATVYSVSSLSDTSHGNITGETLTFISVKDTVFLRANSISHGWVDQTEILVIPDLVQMQFLVSEGLRGGTEQEWHDYQGMFARCVRHLSFSSITGYQGILEEGPDGNELLLASNSCLADTDVITAQSQAQQAAKERKQQRIAYENLRLSTANQNKEGHVNNRRLNGGDRTEDQNEVLLTDIYDSIGFAETPENGEVLLRSRLNRHPSDDVRVISCNNSTLDYRRPREDRRGPKQESQTAAVSTLEASDDVQRSCSIVSNSNSDAIDQLFDDIVDLNEVDETLGAANGAGEASKRHNIQSIGNNLSQKETDLNLKSTSARNDIGSEISAENTDLQLNRISIEMDTKREDLGKKASTATEEASGPSSKVNVLRCISKFQSPSQPQTDVAKTSGHQRQGPEGKSEARHADGPNDHAKPQKPFQLERSRPTITDKPKSAAHGNLIQPPQRPGIVGDKPSVANGAQMELSRHPNRLQEAQKPGSPLHDSEQNQMKRIGSSSSKPLPPASGQPPPPPPISRTPASKPLPDSNGNRSSQLENISNRNPSTRAPVAPSVSTSKPTPPENPAVQRPSPIRDAVIKSSADVPSELESLSVAGVGQCLELLHLDKHVADFNRNAVDGRKLTDLTEKVLEDQFHFSPLDASKLVRFVRGWRP